MASTDLAVGVASPGLDEVGGTWAQPRGGKTGVELDLLRLNSCLCRKVELESRWICCRACCLESSYVLSCNPTETVCEYEVQYHRRLEQERAQWNQYRESAERELAELRRRLTEGQEENLEDDMKKVTYVLLSMWSSKCNNRNVLLITSVKAFLLNTAADMFLTKDSEPSKRRRRMQRSCGQWWCPWSMKSLRWRPKWSQQRTEWKNWRLPRSVFDLRELSSKYSFNSLMVETSEERFQTFLKWRERKHPCESEKKEHKCNTSKRKKEHIEKNKPTVESRWSKMTLADIKRQCHCSIFDLITVEIRWWQDLQGRWTCC